MSEWNVYKALAYLIPANRDKPPAPMQSDGGELTLDSLGLGDAQPETKPEPSTVAPKTGGLVQLTAVNNDIKAISNNDIKVTLPTVQLGNARSALDAAPAAEGQPQRVAFSTMVDLVEEAERAVAATAIEKTDPFTTAAVERRGSINSNWVIDEPVEQGELNFGRAAWSFAASLEGLSSPGPISLNYAQALDFLRTVTDVRGDRDEDGYAISPEIADATGPSPRGSTFYRDALQCHRRMGWRYYYGLVPKTDAPWLLAGTVIHRALAYYWANQMENPPSWHNPDMHALEGELLRLAPANPTLVREALTIMMVYEKYYATGPQFAPNPRRRLCRKDREWTPVSVEQIYSCSIDELDPPHLIDEQVAKGLRRAPTALELSVGKAVVTIRPDILVTHISRPDLILLVDHKTEGDDWTGSFKKTKLKVWEGDDKYSTHFQFFVYLHVLRKLFGHDKVSRHPIVQRVRRTAPFQMHRHEVTTDAKQLYDSTPAILRRGAAEAQLVKDQAQKTIWLDTGSMPCYSPWPCSYIPICEAKNDEIAANIIAGRYYRIPV